MNVYRLPAFQDNYFWIIENPDAPEEVAVVDPGNAVVVDAWLAANNRRLALILLTHHHADHVGGAAQLREEHGCSILGPAGDAARISFEYRHVIDEQIVDVLGLSTQVIAVPGHTLGHIAYWFSVSGKLFCGDTLFAMGCGRLFEGTAEQMWGSLNRLKSLPDATLVYCAHEYTQSNCRFAFSEEPENLNVLQRCEIVADARASNMPTVPFELGIDKLSNPFLRVNLANFAALRQRKDNFR